MTPPRNIASELPLALEDEYRDALADWAKRRGVTVPALLQELQTEQGSKKLDAAKIRALVLAEWRSIAPAHKQALGEDGPGGASDPLRQALGAVKDMKKKRE